TLTIEPGTVIKFATGDDFDYRIGTAINRNFNVGFLRVKGSLIANGEINNIILFTHEDINGKWGNLVLDNAKNVEINYCIFKYSYYIRGVVEDDNATGAISFLACSGTVKNTIVTNSWVGVNAKKSAEPIVDNCIFCNNNYAIESNTYSKITVTNTIVKNNVTQFYTNPGATIILSNSYLQDDDLINGVYAKENIVYNNLNGIDNNLDISKCSPSKRAKDNNKR
ncbi:MAG: hypothetical protein U9Q83_11635, partial [Bacteroidota bacterium]|nr:hypothetical protein [Bacteroidota bacterium]